MATPDENARQALHAAVDRMYDKLVVAERDKNSRFLSQLLQLIQKGESVEQLLQQQLSDLRSETADESTVESPNQAAALKAELDDLRRRFNALATNFNLAKAAIKQRTSSRNQWIQHASQLERVIADAEKKHAIKIAYTKSRSPGVASVATPKHSPDADVPDASSGNNKPGPDASTQSTQSDSQEEQQLPSLPPPPCDSTSDQPASEHSSDIPVVISERPVRKKRRKDSGPVRVKIEPADGSSPRSAARVASDTQRSLDLGDIAKKIVTPRKRKAVTSLDSGYDSIASDPATSFLTRFAVSATPSKTIMRAHNRNNSVLTPLNVNIQPSAAGADDFKDRRPRRGIAHAISRLAGDGDVYRAHTPPAKPQAVTNSRLNVLLNGPSPAADDSLLGRSADRWQAESKDSLPIPHRRELPFDKASAVKARLRSGPPLQITTPRSDPSVTRQQPQQPTPDPRDGPSLRRKPQSELRPEDFKINPQANDGYDFAFTEVVRDKTERSCLPGCTDPHCCGKHFAALARSQRPNPPLTPEQRAAEQKLLESYLGDAAFRLASMTGPERADLWVEAKAKELADKYGRHRHRFPRPRSPPGFWNADFPDTQERDRERAEAVDRERLVVADRYREALRPGGRWLFKDE
ncbi:DNA repair protein Sae2/CtIP [Ophiocordyceps camponoti-floridani]|uniref:DNA repair protein Sae2/CtIP n=1 Tax=Ophiocordyceps camponoti-floridani TaxID=2030778 RepID=A0A8H4Q244_9HYPO|nr:DNA repair protein Sae2/CtIP [Ophiocordyceps camponoti-floridani]